MNAIPDPLSIDDVHLTLPVADRAEAARLYDLLLGAGTDDRWAAANGSVALADGDQPLTVDLRVADVGAATALLRRRGLNLDEQTDVAALSGFSPLRIAGLGGRDAGGRMIDHAVLTIGDADRAIALFGGRLGVNLRLVRDLGKGVSQLFFRTRSAVLEVVAGGGSPTDGIGLMGIAWRSDDIVAEQRRLVDAGLNVSEVRTGRKAGTRVCTVRQPELGTSTLLIQQ